MCTNFSDFVAKSLKLVLVAICKLSEVQLGEGERDRGGREGRREGRRWGKRGKEAESEGESEGISSQISERSLTCTVSFLLNAFFVTPLQ